MLIWGGAGSAAHASTWHPPHRACLVLRCLCHGAGAAILLHVKNEGAIGDCREAYVNWLIEDGRDVAVQSFDHDGCGRGLNHYTYDVGPTLRI